MRERSHRKGETYQQDVKHWLSRTSFLGFETTLFGDAYDVTKKACTIGGLVFDFSLQLVRGDLTRHILYGECKYRDEQAGNVNADFKKFLQRVYESLSAADTDEADSAIFGFFGNLPPDDWRKYLKNRYSYCKEDLDWGAVEPPDDGVLAKLTRAVYVVILNASIVER